MNRDLIDRAKERIKWLENTYETFNNFVDTPSIKNCNAFRLEIYNNNEKRFFCETGSFRMVIGFIEDNYVIKFDYFREEEKRNNEFFSYKKKNNGNWQEKKNYKRLQDYNCTDICIDMLSFFYKENFVLISEKVVTEGSENFPYFERVLEIRKKKQEEMNKNSVAVARAKEFCKKEGNPCEDCGNFWCACFPAELLDEECADLDENTIFDLIFEDYGLEKTYQIEDFLENEGIGDLHGGNIGMGADGLIKIIDLGGYNCSYYDDKTWEDSL